MIEICELTKRYGSRTAVDRLSLTIQQGELFVFLGPNGAGKSTTERVCAGLLHPTEGSVRLCGHDVHRDGQHAKQLLSFVPDEPYLYDKLTGREFMQFVGRMFGLDPATIDRRGGEMIELFRAGDYIDDLTQNYSHGMKRKVVLSAAMIHDPRVLIIDEPLVGLDPKSCRALVDLLRRRANEGLTIFMSTHTISVAEELADRIGIIHEGRLVAAAPPSELRRLAAHSERLEDVFLELTAESAPGS